MRVAATTQRGRENRKKGKERKVSEDNEEKCDERTYLE